MAWITSLAPSWQAFIFFVVMLVWILATCWLIQKSVLFGLVLSLVIAIPPGMLMRAAMYKPLHPVVVTIIALVAMIAGLTVRIKLNDRKISELQRLREQKGYGGVE